MLIFIVLSGCGLSEAHCGKSFCITEKPTSFSSEQQVDFNLYRVDLDGKQFAIYEGNQPDTLNDQDFGLTNPDMVPDGFVEARLYRSQNGFKEVLRTMNRRWPAYVAVSVESKNPNDLDLLVSKLRGKQSSEG